MHAGGFEYGLFASRIGENICINIVCGVRDEALRKYSSKHMH